MMTDWNKLKVVDLKAALKQRGLPQTGLKPALIARLAEAESQDGSPESEATIQDQDQDDDKQDASSAASPDTIATALPPSGLSTELVAPDEPSAALPEAQLDLPAQIETAVVSTPEIPHQVAEAQIDTADEGNLQDLNTTVTQTETPPPQSPDVIPPPQSVEEADSHSSALPSVEPQEAIEDRLKRKRRSASPSVSTDDASRKRFRTDEAPRDDEGVATTQSDADWVEKHNATDAEGINAEAMEVGTAETLLPEPTIVDASREEILVEGVGVSDQMEVDGTEEGKSNTGGTTTTHSHEDISKNRDSRFTNLFTKPSQSQSLDLPSDSMEYETDRIVSPARHPATSALYIRNLMRPLNATQLQSHLAALATPPGQEIGSDIILNFYLDPIKTHAFVILTNTSAASRVRNAFHDRIWPDEKTRKPLWVDFVPVEKAEEWIAEEVGSNSGGRGQAKKWEVVYDEDEDRHVTATLQEVSATSHQVHPSRQPAGPGVYAQAPMAARSFQPPSGPRGFVNQPQKAAANVARLDQLFSSTATKPVLYFKPVSKELADKRLDNIDAALSQDGEAGRRIVGEIHRYTFEDNDVLVDRGPEIFSGIRPPMRGGGGRGGGRGGGGNFRPRGNGGGGYGGGYGGDRGGERRYDSYRGERRDSRDDRRY